MLQSAALLHDIGLFVSYKKHHKHSLYLIAHSELPTFTAHEMQLVGNVARYHRKGEPAAHHPLFAELPAPDQDRVVRLSAILRLADALDREHLQRVRRAVVRASDGQLELWLDGAGELLLEGWSMKKKSQLFQRVFDCKVKLRFIGDEP